ncbi:TPA: radical SAM protein [Bacillus cereus]|nr:radical SAM protein [Bacillus cereus]
MTDDNMENEPFCVYIPKLSRKQKRTYKTGHE